MGLLVMLGGTAMGWPVPAQLLPSLVTTAAVVLLIALRLRVAEALGLAAVLALAAMQLALLVVVDGQLRWWMEDGPRLRGAGVGAERAAVGAGGGGGAGVG